MNVSIHLLKITEFFFLIQQKHTKFSKNYNKTHKEIIQKLEYLKTCQIKHKNQTKTYTKH